MDIEVSTNTSDFDEEEHKTQANKRLKGSPLALLKKFNIYVAHKSGQKYVSIANEMKRAPNTVLNVMTKANIYNSLDNMDSKKGRFPLGGSSLADNHRRFIIQWIEAGEHNSSRQVYLHLKSIKTLSKVCYDDEDDIYESEEDDLDEDL